MDIYELLKEENQRFWDFLNFDDNLNGLEPSMQQDDTSLIVEEIELV